MIDVLPNHTNLDGACMIRICVHEPGSLTFAAVELAPNVALQIRAEHGRGLVLVGVARLDLALEHLLKAVMAPSAGEPR